LVVIPVKNHRYLRLGKIVDIPKYPFRIVLRKKLPVPRRPRRPGPEKPAAQKPFPPLVPLVPYPRRYDVPSRTRGIKPGKR